MPDEDVKEKGAEEEVVDSMDDFDAAFEEATGPDNAEEKPAEALEKERAEDFTDAEVAGEKLTEGQQKTEEEPPSKEPEKAPEKEPEVDYKKLFEEEQHKRSTLEGMYNKTVEELDTFKKAPEKEAAKPDKEAPPEKTLDEELMDDDEVKGFLEEYDYFAKPIQKMIAKSIERATAMKIAPALELTNVLKEAMEHQGAITKAHPDFATIRDTGELKRFVEEAPDTERPELQRIYADGSTQDVIKLVDRFKEAKKAAPSAKDEGSRSEEKKEKLANLTVVKTGKRPLNPDSKGKPENFEDAWDEASSRK
jgi:hypothetical protein